MAMVKMTEPTKAKRLRGSCLPPPLPLVMALALVLLGDTRVSGFSAASFQIHSSPIAKISTNARFSPSPRASAQTLRLFSTPQKGDDDESNNIVNNHEIRKDQIINNPMSRRSAIMATAASSILFIAPTIATARGPNNLILQTAPTSGLRWADAKVGSGDSPQLGSTASIDYSMASTAGRFPSIYSTKNSDTVYRWTLGDGSTIQGIELAILGSAEEGIPPMKPGGVRRVIVPNSLGYVSLIQQSGKVSPASKNKRCLADNEGSIGPIPPKDAPDGAYQRWYQFYCNPRIPYQPDLVLDLKLYGKRATR